MKEVPFFTNPEDGWPPIPVENLWCNVADGEYEILSVPVFVGSLSKGDKIKPNFKDGFVISWSYNFQSKNTTIWAFTSGLIDVRDFLSQLNALGCDTVSMTQSSLVAINVPAQVSIHEVENILSALPNIEEDVAYPSFRHDDV